MTFTAPEGRVIYVHYKLAGGMYNVHPMQLAAVVAGNPGKRVTSDPFESVMLRPGESFTLPEGAQFINEQ